MRYSPWLFLTLTLCACSPEPVPFDSVADVEQLMLTVIDPAADVYWDSVGTVMTMEGTEEYAPSTLQEWEAVRNAAIVVSEAGNLLLMPGRIQEGEQWTEMALALVSSGRKALAAAENRDPEAVFTAGGDLYLVCADCHAAFAPEALNSAFTLDD